MLKNWNTDYEDIPWIDKIKSTEELQSFIAKNETYKKYGKELESWYENGYILLKGVISDKEIDGLNHDIDQAILGRGEYKDLVFKDLLSSEEGNKKDLTFEQFHSYPEEYKKELLAKNSWRIHEFYKHSENANRIFFNKKLIDVCSIIFGEEALPSYTINFAKGSQQDLHQDQAVFHMKPVNFLIGAWVACEDITIDSGPLVYYPKTHRSPMYPGFDNYPQTNLRTMKGEDVHLYREYVLNYAKDFTEKEFIAEKGDVLLWHSMLIHGGKKQLVENTSRKSFIIHYTIEGTNKEDEVVGPFLWKT